MAAIVFAVFGEGESTKPPTQGELERAVWTLVQVARSGRAGGGVLTFLGDGLTEPRWRRLLAPSAAMGVHVRVPVADSYDEEELVDVCRFELSEALMKAEMEHYRLLVDFYFRADRQSAVGELAWVSDPETRARWTDRLADLSAIPDDA